MKFHKPPKSRNRGLAKLKQCLSALTLIGVVGAGNTSALAAPAEEAPDFEPLASLKSMVVPEPSYYYELVKNKDAAIALGKALFWEMRIGTDGEKACATCHFSGGADNRLKNQLAPAKSFHNFDEKLPNEMCEMLLALKAYFWKNLSAQPQVKLLMKQNYCLSHNSQWRIRAYKCIK